MSDRLAISLRRAAAVLALGALVAIVPVLVVGVVGDLGAVLVALVGLLVIVLGAWDVLTRRGPARYVALGVAAVGLGVLLFGVLSADLSAWRIVTIVLLGILSAGAARIALGKVPRRTPAAPSGPGTPALQPVLIMNLKSGGGKAERFQLVEECTARGIEPVVLGPGDDLLELAESAVARGADVIGMAGGDGSQALVASVAAHHGLPFVVVPAGTRNHFALDLGLDRDDVVGALDAFASGVEQRVDLATVNGRVFVNNATLGLYAKIVQSPDYRDAKRQTAADMLPDMLGPEAPRLDLRFVGPDGEEHSSADVMLISNNPYELRHAAGRGSRARLDRGELGVASVAVEDAAAATRLATLLLAGHPQRFPGWLEWSTPRFELSSAGEVEIGIDGEALRLSTPLVFESLPGALRVLLPRSAPGRSPAARAVHLLSASTLVALWGVIVHPNQVQGNGRT